MVDVEETFAIVSILEDACYQDLSARCTRRRYDTAAWLIERGIGSRGARLLWLYAKKVADNPEALFAHWLDIPSRCEKKLREALARPEFVKQAKEAMKLQDEPFPAAPIHPIRRKSS